MPITCTIYDTAPASTSYAAEWHRSRPYRWPTATARARLFASHEALRLFLQRQARDYFRQEYPMQRLALYDVAPLETGIRSALHRTRKKPGEGITIEQKAVLPYAIPHGIFDMAPDLEHYLRFVAQNGVGHLYVTPHNRRIVQLLHIREHGRLLPELFVPAD